MYKIEKKGYGYKLTFADQISKDEMTAWVQESEKALAAAPAKFGVFVDMRTLKPLAADAKAEMEKGQILYKQKGMERSVVILASAMLTLQFKQIAKQSGIYQWERYISEADDPDWEKTGEAWLISAKDPDA